MSIQRYAVNPAMLNEHGRHGAMSWSRTGKWVRHDDHLAALTEERESLRQTLRAVERRASNAESLCERLEAAVVAREEERCDALERIEELTASKGGEDG